MKKEKKSILESYRRLRNLVEGCGNEQVKCIVVTCNEEFGGKTNIAKNFAMTLAKSGNKTLFIDCSLSEHSDVKGISSTKVSLIGLLEAENRAPLNESQLLNYINNTQQENLSTLTLGDSNLDRHGSIFKAVSLKAVMERLKKSFDYIIVDAPSFENYSYTQIIASAADRCLFVIKEGRNEVSEANLIKNKLDNIGCKVLGCALDKEKRTTKIFDDRQNSLFNKEPKGKIILNEKVSNNA